MFPLPIPKRHAVPEPRTPSRRVKPRQSLLTSHPRPPLRFRLSSPSHTIPTIPLGSALSFPTSRLLPFRRVIPFRSLRRDISSPSIPTTPSTSLHSDYSFHPQSGHSDFPRPSATTSLICPAHLDFSLPACSSQPTSPFLSLRIARSDSPSQYISGPPQPTIRRTPRPLAIQSNSIDYSRPIGSCQRVPTTRVLSGQIPATDHPIPDLSTTQYRLALPRRLFSSPRTSPIHTDYPRRFDAYRHSTPDRPCRHALTYCTVPLRLSSPIPIPPDSPIHLVSSQYDSPSPPTLFDYTYHPESHRLFTPFPTPPIDMPSHNFPDPSKSTSHPFPLHTDFTYRISSIPPTDPALPNLVTPCRLAKSGPALPTSRAIPTFATPIHPTSRVLPSRSTPNPPDFPNPDLAHHPADLPPPICPTRLSFPIPAIPTSPTTRADHPRLVTFYRLAPP